MDNNALVCICIPNYNNESTISKTLDSIINQTYSNIIIKIFDNASTDNSVQILRKYEKKYSNVRVFENEKNIGGEANFSKCIENMEGDFSAIYHSDDIYSPTIVFEEINALQKNDISAVFVNANIIDEDDNVTSKVTIPSEFINEDKYIELSFIELIKSNMKNDNFLVCPTAMSRTKVYKEYIKSWDGHKYKSATDISIWLKFAELGKIGLITKELINYRYSDDSFSYRRLKTRTELKDYFLVMNDFTTRDKVKNNLTKQDYMSYKFLKFKDNIVITRNSIFNGKCIYTNISIFDPDIVRISLTNSKFFLYYCAGIFYRLISYKNIIAKIFKFIKKD